MLRDFDEGSQVQYDPMDHGQISLQITEFVYAGSSISGKLADDSYMAQYLEGRIPKEHLRKIAERSETDLLAQSENQTQADPNAINGYDHRWVAGTSTAGLIDMQDFVYAKLSLDKANVPTGGRVAVVDASVEAAINLNFGTSNAVSFNPMFEGIVTTGMAQNMRFIRNIYGFDVYVSDRLPRVTSETIVGGPQDSSTAVTDGVVNQFFSVMDDQHKPYMGAWRRTPETHGEYNKDRDQDEFVTFARWGYGLQRPQSLVSVLTQEGLIQ